MSFLEWLQSPTILKTKQISFRPLLPLHPTISPDRLFGPTRKLLQSTGIAMVRNESVTIPLQPANNVPAQRCAVPVKFYCICLLHRRSQPHSSLERHLSQDSPQQPPRPPPAHRPVGPARQLSSLVEDSYPGTATHRVEAVRKCRRRVGTSVRRRWPGLDRWSPFLGVVGASFPSRPG